MRRLFVTLAYGVAGIVLALALSLGAFAVAGREIADPTETLGTLTPALAPPTPEETPTGERSPGKEDDARPSVSASDEDHDDDGSNSGPGSDDDLEDDDSGSGSDDSGHGEHEDD